MSKSVNDSDKPSRPALQGFNHNISYRGRVYHVQTEDSGVDRPHIFTHLFHSGMIIASLRADYSELAQTAGHEPALRKMMQEQHKDLMKALRRGEHDSRIEMMIKRPIDHSDEAAPTADTALTHPDPPYLDPRELSLDPATMSAADELMSDQTTEKIDSDVDIAPDILPSSPPLAPLGHEQPAVQGTVLPPVAAHLLSPKDKSLFTRVGEISSAPSRASALARPRRVTAPYSNSNTDVPVDTRSRLPEIQGAESAAYRASQQPPPPSVRYADAPQRDQRPSGGIYEITSEGAKPVPASTPKAVLARPAIVLRGSRPSAQNTPEAQAPPVGTSAPANTPANIKNKQASPRSKGRASGSRISTFGSDLVSERSLDEVILQYLSGDNKS